MASKDDTTASWDATAQEVQSATESLVFENSTIMLNDVVAIPKQCIYNWAFGNLVADAFRDHLFQCRLKDLQVRNFRSYALKMGLGHIFDLGAGIGAAIDELQQTANLGE